MKVYKAHHDLKTLPKFWQAVAIQVKTAELRKNDREFKVGDIIALREYLPPIPPEDGRPGYSRGYTGRYLFIVITRVDDYPEALRDGYVMLSFHRIDAKLSPLFAFAECEAAG